MQVESKYGESISIKDIIGHEVVKERRGRGPIDGTMSADARRAEGRREHHSEVTRAPAKTIDDAVEELSKDGSPSRAVRKAPTDTKNAPFEEWLRSRRVRDFLAEQVMGVATRALEHVRHVLRSYPCSSLQIEPPLADVRQGSGAFLGDESSSYRLFVDCR